MAVSQEKEVVKSVWARVRLPVGAVRLFQATVPTTVPNMVPSTSRSPSIYKSSSEFIEAEAPAVVSPMTLYATSVDPLPPILIVSVSARTSWSVVPLPSMSIVKSPVEETVNLASVVSSTLVSLNCSVVARTSSFASGVLSPIPTLSAEASVMRRFASLSPSTRKSVLLLGSLIATSPGEAEMTSWPALAWILTMFPRRVKVSSSPEA